MRNEMARLEERHWQKLKLDRKAECDRTFVAEYFPISSAENPKFVYLATAEEDESGQSKLLGFAICSVKVRGKVFVFELHTTGEVRGVGTQLLQMCAAEQKATVVELEVLWAQEKLPDADNAILFYEKRGFKKTNRRTGREAYCMQWRPSA
jgi:ribosomal protein S18 acetylase RimI-like enzyme